MIDLHYFSRLMSGAVRRRGGAVKTTIVQQPTSLRTAGRRGSVLLASGALVIASIAGAYAAPATADPATQASPTLRTFEADAVGSVPTGCTGSAGSVAVSDIRGFESAQSLRINDQSSTSFAQFICQDVTRQGADFKFVAFPAQLTNGFIFSLFGHRQGIASTPQTVFHFNVVADGSVRWYDGAAWTPIAAAGTIRLNQWTSLEIQVPVDNSAAHLFVNGRYVADGGPWGVRAIADITGFQVSSNGTVPKGDDLFIDNVSMGDPVAGPSPANTSPFTFGSTVTIDQASSRTLQMPTTSVIVPDATAASGRRTLVVYSAHADTSDTSGNQMASSTDGGRSWQPDQDRNPMPGAPSSNISRLRNGDLLAVNYHTYMIAGSQNLQAEVPIAISRDGGVSWTHQSGVMIAPQTMRPISSVSDRPGVPLGGFVLVHSVIEDPDGTLYQSGYGYYDGDPKYRQILLTSQNEGLSWTVRATIAVNPTLSTAGGYEGPCEGAIARVADGSLLAVMRTGSYHTMYVARSLDNGATWSPIEPLRAGPDAKPVAGIFPTLTLMANGTLVLLVGRPGLSLLVSPDGSGKSWTQPTTLDYLNSGNGTFLPIDANHFLAFGDRGANWSWPTPNPYGVWSRIVRVQQPCAVNLTGVHNGPLNVDATGTCLNGATVNGPVTVTAGGILVAGNSTIHGPIRADGANTVTLCGTVVDGPVTAVRTSGALTLGDSTRACSPNTIRGPLTLSSNFGLVTVDPTSS